MPSNGSSGDHEAWVTLVTNDSYSFGALVLAASLRRVKTTKRLVVMITKSVADNIVRVLNEAFDEVVVVEPLDSKDLVNLNLLDRPELGVTFTKLHCWSLTQYSKCVFMDADTLVIRNSDELFEREELSAAPDAGWPDCFNSGVFVFRPNYDTFKSILAYAMTTGSFDGGDQGLLNTYFSESWSTDISRHLPFLYNMCATATYSYLPAYKHFGMNVKIVHFIGHSKPWLVQFDPAGVPVAQDHEKHAEDHLRLWWQIFCSAVRPKLVVGNVQAASCLEVSVCSAYREEPPPPPADNRESWERGCPDYTGSAAFENILKKIDLIMNEKKPETVPKSNGASAAAEKTPAAAATAPAGGDPVATAPTTA